MRASEAFPSKWIAAADLNDKNIRLTIARVEMEDIGDDRKPVIYFQNAKKGLVCNKTNSKSIVAAYGDEMDDWAGCELILFPIMTEYQGNQVPAVRVRAPQPKDNPKPKQETKPATALAPSYPPTDMDDTIPF